MSPDWRLSIAYNAALQLATLALAAEGYRPERLRVHERAIQSLRLTIAADPRLVDTLDGVRRKRNLINYERAGTTSRSEASEIGTRCQAATVWHDHALPGLESSRGFGPMADTLVLDVLPARKSHR